RGERRQQSREHVPERRRSDRRRRPSLYDELDSRGFTRIEVEDEEEGESPPRQAAIEPAASWRPRSTRLQLTARSLRRHRAQWVARGVALLIVVGVLLVAVLLVGRTAPRAVNAPRAVAPSTAPSGTGVSERETAAVSPSARSTQTPRTPAAPPSSTSPAN